MITPKNKKLDEESYTREEKSIFNGSEPEKLKIIQTLICFANYQGGELRVYEVKNRSDFKNFFDAANIENKINSFIEPSIRGIIAVKHVNNKKGVSITIKKSSQFPHFYKKDGCFINFKNKKIFIFQRGSIGIRRSGYNDVYNNVDFEQMFKKKIAEIFGSIQDIVIKQPMGKLMDALQNIKKISTELVPYVYNPSDPLAIPIKQIFDTEPFKDLEEELKAAIKLWKTNGTLANENLICRAYLKFTRIKNQEWVKFLFLSSIERRLPLCLWSTNLKRNELDKMILDVVKKDFYPSAQEIVKLIPLLPSKKAKIILNISAKSKYISVTNLVQKVLDNVSFNHRLKLASLKNTIYGTRNIYEIILHGEKFRIDVNNSNEDNFKKIVFAFTDTNKDNKANLKNIWRSLDMMVYGGQLAK